MDNHLHTYTDYHGMGWLFFFALLAALYLWNQNSKLTEQVQNMQDEVSSYQQCVSDYQDEEQTLTNAVQEASSDLDIGGSDYYQEAQMALDVDTSGVSCDAKYQYPQ